MIVRLTSEVLRKLADQVDALTAMETAGADHLAPNTVITVDGNRVAYAHWWQDREVYMAEFICFTPGENTTPLYYHDARDHQHGCHHHG